MDRNLLHINPDGVEPNALIVKKGSRRKWLGGLQMAELSDEEIENKSAYVIRTNDVVCGDG